MFGTLTRSIRIIGLKPAKRSSTVNGFSVEERGCNLFVRKSRLLFGIAQFALRADESFGMQIAGL